MDAQTTFRARRSPRFLRYWIGGFLSSTGTSLQNVAAAVLILELTGSPIWIGYLSAATFGPLFVFGLFGGAISDRWGHRRVVDATSAWSIVVSGALAALTALGKASPALLLGAALLLGTSYAFAKPNWSAVLPRVVPREHLAPATAISVLQFNGGNIAGAVASAGILVVWGPATAFAINAVTFVAPMVAVRALWSAEDAAKLTTSVPSDAQSHKRSTLQDVAEGLRFFSRKPQMVAVLLFLVALDVGAEAFRTLAVPLAGLIADDERIAGVLLAGSSVPMAALLLVYGRLHARHGTDRLRRTGFLLQGCGMLGVGLAPSLLLAMTAATLLGAGVALVLPGLSATLQLSAPPRLLGRVSSAFAVTHIGLRPLGGMAAGALAALLGAPSAMMVLGMIPLACAVLVRRRRLVTRPTPTLEATDA